MRYSLPLGLSLLASVGFAAPVSPTTPAAAEGPIGSVARVVWLDKQTNTRQVMTLQAGTPQTLGGLVVKMDKCLPDVQGQANTDTAWLQIAETGRGNDWFKGWMVNTMPEIAALEHPRYDIQLVGCGTKARLRSGPVARSGAVIEPGIDTESVSAENDPFAVPGVSDTSVVPNTEPAAVVVPDPDPISAPEPQPEPTPQPVLDTEQPLPAEKTPTPNADQQGLERMMDGVY